MLPSSITLHSTTFILHVHRSPSILHSPSFTLHPSPSILQPPSFPLHPSPSILHPPSFPLCPPPLILQSYRKSWSSTLMKPFLFMFFFCNSFWFINLVVLKLFSCAALSVYLLWVLFTLLLITCVISFWIIYLTKWILTYWTIERETGFPTQF